MAAAKRKARSKKAIVPKVTTTRDIVVEAFHRWQDDVRANPDDYVEGEKATPEEQAEMCADHFLHLLDTIAHEKLTESTKTVDASNGETGLLAGA